MGNRVTVKVAPETVSIRRERKNARPYAMGTVGLKSVTVNHDSLSGEWLYEFEEIRELDAKVADKMTELVYLDRFGFGVVTVHEGSDGEDVVMFESATGNTYRAAYVFGESVFVG